MNIIEKLPYELIILTLYHMDIKTIINIASINKKYNKIIMNNINNMVINHILNWKYNINQVEIKYADIILCNKYLSVNDNISTLFKYLINHETSLNTYVTLINDCPKIDRECLFLHYLISNGEYDYDRIDAVCLTINKLLMTDSRHKYLTYLLASALYNHNLDLLTVLTMIIKKLPITLDFNFLNNFAFISMDNDTINFYIEKILNDRIMSVKTNISMVSKYFNKCGVEQLLTSMIQKPHELNDYQLIEFKIKLCHNKQLSYKLII